MFSFLSSLKYRMFGKFMKSRSRARTCRENIEQMLKEDRLVKNLTLSDIAVKYDINFKQRSEILDLAYFTAKEYSFMRNPESLTTLRDIYDRLKMLERENKILLLMKKLLSKRQDFSNVKVLDMMLEHQILLENYRNKTDRYSRPSHESLAKMTTKIHMKRDVANDTRRELDSLIEDTSDDESDNGDEEKFQSWLSCLIPSLQPTTHEHIDDIEELQQRLNKLKS